MRYTATRAKGPLGLRPYLGENCTRRGGLGNGKVSIRVGQGRTAEWAVYRDIGNGKETTRFAPGRIDLGNVKEYPRLKRSQAPDP
ncbi:hypothetical protein ABH19_02995 [Leptospirillum sp. Group II 'CF-1']|jgi:hypothetical protein|nr:hypothetical protein ABH19_02995 [Leptospirillum sp. Group II 'CF-1']